MTDGRSFAAVLDRYRRRVQSAVLDGLPRGEGVLHDLLPDYPGRPGKGLRGALVLATATAYGGREEDALPFAAGVELLHNAFLVHDDVVDASERRRGELTMPARVGTGISICVGDMLAVHAIGELGRAAAHCGQRMEDVLGEVERTVALTLEGQATELAWEREGRLDVTQRDYLAMAVRKTSWYSVTLPCRLGLLAAGLVPGERFVVYGALTGAVLQIGDDLLSYTGCLGETGKDWADDVVEGKRTLPVIELLATLPAGGDRERLCGLLTGPREERRGHARWLVDLLDATGCLARARSCAAALAESAHAELTAELADAADPVAACFLHDLTCTLADRCAR